MPSAQLHCHVMLPQDKWLRPGLGSVLGLVALHTVGESGSRRDGPKGRGGLPPACQSCNEIKGNRKQAGGGASCHAVLLLCHIEVRDCVLEICQLLAEVILLSLNVWSVCLCAKLAIGHER